MERAARVVQPLPDSGGKGYPNGYMMAFRKDRMRHAQFDGKQRLLFDPKWTNIGNEDELWARLRRRVKDAQTSLHSGEGRPAAEAAALAQTAELGVGIHTGAFVFHFKGYTLFKAPGGDRQRLDHYAELD